MSIKLFSKGLGIISTPFDVTGNKSIVGIDKTQNGDVTITVDHASSPALNDSGVTDAIEFGVESSNEPRQFSKQSGPAPYDTLFNDFDLKVVPVYNFWTADETRNDTEERGIRKLEDIPRYVKLSWNVAPDFKSDVKEVINVAIRGIEPVTVGSETQRPPQSSDVTGINPPEHLLPDNFSQIKNAIANGFLSPGVIEANVEFDPQEKTRRKVDDVVIDENAFLSSPDMRGISINELSSQVNAVTNSVIGAGQVSTATLTKKANVDRGNFFNGKFAVSFSTVGGGAMNIESTAFSSPGISVESNTAIGDRDSRDDVLDMVKKISAAPQSPEDKKSSFVKKVRFVESNIGGVLGDDKVAAMMRPEHAENTIAMSQMLPQLEMLAHSTIKDDAVSLEIPSFPSPAGLKPLEYIGYIVEKYRNQSGTFVKIEEIEFPNRRLNEYIDTKVLYGNTYRYRIHTILRWTRKADSSDSGASPLAQYRSSYFASEWSKNWAYGTLIDSQPPFPPDELTVMPDSSRRKVSVSFKIPHNPQRDITQMILYRKLQDKNGKDRTNWTEIARRSIANVLYVDRDVDTTQKNGGLRYVYSTRCFTAHGEYSNLSEQIAVALNDRYRFEGEYPAEFVSCAGVDFSYYGSFSVSPPKSFDTELVIVPQNETDSAAVTFTGRETARKKPLQGSNYIVRIESLDTGEKLDVPLNIVFKQVKESEQEVIARSKDNKSRRV